MTRVHRTAIVASLALVLLAGGVATALSYGPWRAPVSITTAAAPAPSVESEAAPGRPRSDDRELLDDSDGAEATGPAALESGWTAAFDEGGHALRRWFEDNTGNRVDAGDLEVHDGNYTVTEDGGSVEKMLIRGVLHIRAADVTVTDVTVESSAPYPVRLDWTDADGNRPENRTLEYVTIDGMRSGKNNGGVYGGNYTIRHSELLHHTDTAKVQSNAIWEYNYLHSNGKWDTDAHVDGLQSAGASNVVVRRNYAHLPEQDSVNSVMFFAAQRGDLRGIVVEENYLNGGYYTVQMLGEEGRVQDVVVRNNRFGPDYRHGVIRTSGNPVDDDGNIDDLTGESL